ncbi:hypothetical protein B0A49_12368, partial [Cryomyces minteri]
MDSRRGSIGSDAPSSSSSDLYRSTGSVQEELSSKDDVEDLPLMKRGLDSVDPEGPGRLARLRFDEQELPQMTKRELESDGFDESVETKRRKVEQLPDDTMTATALTTAGLPAEIWQYVFQWLPPTCLGQVLQVSQAFKRYLTDIQPGPSSNPISRLHVVEPET